MLRSANSVLRKDRNDLPIVRWQLLLVEGNPEPQSNREKAVEG